MSEDLRHECGVAARYWLDEAPKGLNGRVSRNRKPVLQKAKRNLRKGVVGRTYG